MVGLGVYRGLKEKGRRYRKRVKSGKFFWNSVKRKRGKRKKIDKIVVHENKL